MAVVKTNHQDKEDYDHLIAGYVRISYEKETKIYVPLSLKKLMGLFSNKIIPSKLLTFREDLKFASALVSKISGVNQSTTFSLMFTATEHDDNKAFHGDCDRVHNTITIIKSNWGNVFGGYAEAAWMSKEHAAFIHETGRSIKAARYSISDDAAFLFLIRSKDVKLNEKAPLVFPIEGAYLWYHYENGPSWGTWMGLELILGDKCKAPVREEPNAYCDNIWNDFCYND